MTAVVFYEKPGCITNAKQKAQLRAQGCELSVRDLLSEPWTETRLYSFLCGLPVARWFNPAAPRIKSGEIDPARQDERSALQLLVRDPLLIRRPLLETALGRTAGLDDPATLEALGVSLRVEGLDAGCSRPAPNATCPPTD